MSAVDSLPTWLSLITLSFAPGPSESGFGFDGSEYSGFSLAFIKVHELCHWALKSEEQPETPFEEEGWHAVL